MVTSGVTIVRSCRSALQHLRLQLGYELVMWGYVTLDMNDQLSFIGTIGIVSLLTSCTWSFEWWRAGRPYCCVRIVYCGDSLCLFPPIVWSAIVARVIASEHWCNFGYIPESREPATPKQHIEHRAIVGAAIVYASIASFWDLPIAHKFTMAVTHDS